MAQAGWNLDNATNYGFYNVQGILQREELDRMEYTINRKAREAVDRSA